MMFEKSVKSIQGWLVSQLASLLETTFQNIDLESSFSDYGLDSVRATNLIENLATELGCQLSPTLIWEYPNIKTLAGYLAGTPNRQLVGSNNRRKSQKLATEPIAIIGIACRFPRVQSTAAFWQLLKDEVDTISALPAELWRKDTFNNDASSNRWGGFLDDIDKFDANFFGISPKEVVQIDPQQRLMLKLTWEALADAGLPVETLRRSRTGVFVGAMWADYANLIKQAGLIAQHTATGQDLSIIANRISYIFGFQGASLTVNTACSSSLVAVHLACQSLRSGESTLALAGGVNLTIDPNSTSIMSKFGGLSAEGRCKTFDANADGYVRSEGAGIVVLKPLSLALAAGDPIYCVIRGSAVNNDGFSNGLTAPNPKAQEGLLQDVYEQAGINPNQVHYVETHGTGTKLGDPIEAKALGAVLSRDRPVERPLILGSVKTNIGHLEAAAGIAGLIKVVLAIKHRQIPPNLHFHQPNPEIPFDELHLKVQTSLTNWPYPEEPALAGVSSFGFGGTNCHVVVQELLNISASRFPLLIPLAANSEKTLQSLCQELKVKLQTPKLPLKELIAFDQLDGSHKLAMVVDSHTRAAEYLENFLQGKNSTGLYKGTETRDRPIVFVFSGQGSQWFGMGKQLLESEPVFRATLEQCDRLMQQYVDWSLLEELTVWFEEKSRLNDIDVMWPILFAIEVALASLWKHWGIKPDVVVGHSIGEVAAAHVAGILNLSDAVRIIYHLSHNAAILSGSGAMALVGLPWEKAKAATLSYEGSVYPAIDNSPISTVLSGNQAVLETLLAQLQRDNIFGRLVKTNIAVHTPQMESLDVPLLEILQDIKPQPGETLMISTLTGTPLDGHQFNASYWAGLLKKPVLFSQAIAYLLTKDFNTFLEVSPHPILVPAIQQTLQHYGQEGTVLESLRRGKEDRYVILQSLGQLYTLGKSIRWHHVYNQHFETKIIDSQNSLLTSQPQVQIFSLSAQNPAALKDLSKKLYIQLTEQTQISLNDLCYSASRRWSHLNHRLAVAIASIEELKQYLNLFAQDNLDSTCDFIWENRRRQDTSVVFVFSGQGSQWPTMGQELLGESVFQAVCQECDREFRRYLNWSVLEEIQKPEDESRLGETAYAQPAIFTIQVALAALWNSWGIIPKAVVGHSLGEVAAAYVADILTLADAVQIVFYHSQLMQQTTSRGKIVFQEQLTSLVQRIKPQEPSIPIFSTVTGSAYKVGDFNANYWIENIKEPVCFAQAISAIANEGYDIFVEIAPHPVLSQSIIQCVPEKQVITLPSLHFNQSDRTVMLKSLGQLYTLGHPVNWLQLYPTPGGFISPPSYPWQEQRYWFEESNPPSTPQKIVPKEQESVFQKQQASKLPQLQLIPESDRLDFLITHIQTEAAKILGLRSGQLPDIKIGFFAMGMDSLMVVQLRDRLKTTLGYFVSATVTFNYPTIEALAGYFAKEIFFVSGKSNDLLGQNENYLETNATMIEYFSEAEIEALLLKKLQSF
ncbi:acyltransferase domain-containing protein [Nostoc sp. ChiVER01]|uniref:acyltransferase domain-containing protein n=1 Tax=Nostoc sp. ChiVER01 TaxID=3075382 RepID=UPI002AD5138C|nr:acyltransferase domain-containing protein [Nostoc sp. ChiVER01]MDZ8227265.1 acyltransferase domain-containing protein [Nostoc sp. ChiVER01]